MGIKKEFDLKPLKTYVVIHYLTAGKIWELHKLQARTFKEAVYRFLIGTYLLKEQDLYKYDLENDKLYQKILQDFKTEIREINTIL